ncbi:MULTISPECIES: heavy metal translocating P-type ATPase [unclassified Frankia]|uniref:heavy metal translocating P-type ATPase n=1 Tax=unclassified Frankia TaxID=2632575 RepID=UPI001933B4F6|nr:MULTISPECIES: heavy metal translocating P-type ATPase [unclassified Frankia]MBL7621093.1 heavy metal translocating P-type ATPase [Frankia sp. AgB1.8]
MALLAVTFVGLATGAALWLAGARGAADLAWAVTTVAGLVPAAGGVAVSLWHRRPGVDVIAVLALVGTLGVGEYLAGALIAVMVATGRLLERWAAGRAERALRQLVARMPHTALRRAGAEYAVIEVDELAVGDLLLIRPGEVVPTDGRVETGSAVLDESTLTGESIPVARGAGDPVSSGVVNAGGPFDLRATRTARDSSYAGIVRMVEAAGADTAPFVRLADHYALLFLPVTLAVAALGWVWSGQLARGVAVLVVATPCPLILAAPVAIVAGLSRAAQRGVIVKGGGVLERLAAAQVVLFDKTGTLTAGRPAVTDIVTADGSQGTELLRLAASLDQVSPHVLAAAVVRAARERGLALTMPSEVDEVAGAGIRGLVDGHRVAIGKAAWIGLTETTSGAAHRRDQGGQGEGSRSRSWIRGVRRRSARDGSIAVFVGLDGCPAGALLLDDPLRADAPRMIRRLREAGITRTVMVTGDRNEVASCVAEAVGIDAVLAERGPAEKVDAIRAEERDQVTVMIGDGVNDAPALAAASVGIAVAARGATASSEAADAVLAVDRLDRIAETINIARRSRAIARQSVLLGMGMSLLAMGIAVIGWLPAAPGALLQEAIDLATILNASRALLPGPEAEHPASDRQTELTRRLAAEHSQMRPEVERIRSAAASLGGPTHRDQALAEVRAVHEFCVRDLLPHEDIEDRGLYPMLEPATAPMSRAHVEIHRLVRRLGQLLTDIDLDGPENGDLDPDDARELQQLLYGLYAVLRLHFAQEEEGYFTLADTTPPAG